CGQSTNVPPLTF
nr:immunoglobulin light chain junction region [Macaca mulatta]